MTLKGITKREMKRRIVSACGCTIQHTGWPCGSCFGTIPQANDLSWHAVLAYRGDYDENQTETGYKMCSGIKFRPDGTFSHHEYTEIPAEILEQEIRRLYQVLA